MISTSPLPALLSSAIYCYAKRLGSRAALSLRRGTRFILFLVVIGHLGSSPTIAQNIQHTQNTADLSLRSNSRIDPSTLGMSIEIPMGAYPGRAGTGLPIGLRYSSKVWRMDYAGHDGLNSNGPGWVRPAYAEHSVAGWTSSLGVPYLEGADMERTFTVTGTPSCYGYGCTPTTTHRYIIWRFNVHMPDGSTHELRRSDDAVCINCGLPTPTPDGTYYAVDGSRMRLEYYTGTSAPPNVLYLPDGSRYVYDNASSNVTYYDRHGNTLFYNASTRQWTDTLGRTINQVLPSAPTVGDQPYTMPGVNGSSITYTLRWRALADARTDPSQPLRYTAANSYCSIDYSSPLSPSLFTNGMTCTGDYGELFNPVVLHQIELPNGQTYTFTYNVFGEMDKVVYPTGGYERYSYAEIQTVSYTRSSYAQSNRGVVNRWVSALGNGTDEVQWQYAAGHADQYYNPPYKVTITAPDGSRTERLLHATRSHPAFRLDDVRDGMPYEERVFSSTGQMVRRKLTEWTGTYNGRTYPIRDARVMKEVEIILDTGGNALTTTTSYEYDTNPATFANLNVIATNRYEFASLDQYTAQNGDISQMPLGALARREETSYLYDSTYTTRNMTSLPSSTRIKNGSSTIVAQSEMLYDEASYPLLIYGSVTGWSDPSTTARGNVTTVRRWLDTTGGWLETHAQFDQVGNPRKSWDALGRVAAVEYSATYHYAYPTRTISPIPDPTGERGSTTALETTANYDFSTGLVTSQTDANSKTTSFQYNDALNRLTRIDRPDGGWTRHTYGPTYIETFTRLDASRELYTAQFADGLGRPSRSFALDNGQYQTSDTQYDGLGRVWRVSNPYFSSGSGSPINPSGQWTTSQYDLLGRITSVTTPDNAVVSTSYSGNQVTVTDQAGKSRRSVTDALGRITQVIEDPSGLAYSTEYLYDPLGNLRRVQQGTQTRHFMYDSLSRLIRARQPEQDVNGNLYLYDPVTANTQWTMAYAYDANGNLTTRVDARNVTTTYQYDQINRLIRTEYPDVMPLTLLTYDFGVNGRGRFFQDYESSTSGQVTSVRAYDAMGRPIEQDVQFHVAGSGWTGAYTTRRSYDQSGNVTSQTYPSGRAVSYQYDGAGRTNHVAGNLGDSVSRIYSTSTQYDAASRMTREQFGTQTALYHKRQYNVRGQMASVRLSTINDADNWNRGRLSFFRGSWDEAGESGTTNNGNLWGVRHWIPADDAISSATWVQENYEYDQLNRVSRAYGYHYNGGLTQHYTQGFQYDRWGNRQIDAGVTWGTGINNRQFTIDQNTNRVGVPVGQPGTISYDAAGNQTMDSYSGWGGRDFDAENRMTVQRNTSNQEIARYTYDANGRRVRKTMSGVGTWYLYGFDGELIAEYGASQPAANPQREYGYRNGELLVTATAGMGEPGLRAEYFNSLDFTNPVTTRTDATVNFDWGTGSPGGGVGADNFTVRWTGQVTPQYSETYTFYTLTDDGVRLWVNNQLIIDNWTDHGPTEDSGQITLQAGQSYQIRMEFYERGGGAVAKLSWSSASQAKEIIPASRLMTPTLGSEVRWLITDHLGSPRMTADQTGSLAGIRRHDYLPFGEEIAAGVGGRTTAQGYQPDNIRQQFTGYERDGETGLDYAINRYYASSQGRFTSVDPAGINSMHFENPQTLNRYTYCLNNPLAYVDPDGLDPNDPRYKVGKWHELTDEQRRLFTTYFETKYPQQQIGDQNPAMTPAILWNVSVGIANAGGLPAEGSNFLNQSQMTTFIGVTSLWESKGVSRQIATVTEINGEQDRGSFRLRGDFVEGGGAAVERIFNNRIGGSDKAPYTESRRERGFFDQPNGQFTMTPDFRRFDSDVDYNRLLISPAVPFPYPPHNRRSNSDIRANGHLERHTRSYGPVPITRVTLRR
jgi:RHS repeat-associated protein